MAHCRKSAGAPGRVRSWGLTRRSGGFPAEVLVRVFMIRSLLRLKNHPGSFVSLRACDTDTARLRLPLVPFQPEAPIMISNERFLIEIDQISRFANVGKPTELEALRKRPWYRPRLSFAGAGC